MAERQRKVEREEAELTTADLARRTETAPEDRRLREDKAEQWSGPSLVRESADGDRVDSTSRKTATAPTSLFSESDVHDLRDRWSNVQSDFVDAPRQAVERADKLVATVMQRLAEGFANERSALEKQWASGADVSTEDLRLALQRYRSFFDRLLAA